LFHFFIAPFSKKTETENSLLFVCLFVCCHQRMSLRTN